MHAEKSAVRKAFGAAAGSYEQAASIQRLIAEQLLSLTPLRPGDEVLDAGCGTAYGARLLRGKQTDVRLFVLDAAQPMCAIAQEPRAICADIEQLPLSSACMDLYWSSLAWQWTKAQQAATEAFRVIKRGGHLRVATLGPATLHELRQAFAQIDSLQHVRNFESLNTLHTALSAAGFTDISIQQRSVQSFSADLRSLLQNIRAIGAHELGESRRRTLLGRQAWHKLQASYEHFRCAQGLPATYDVFHISACKP